MKEYMNKIPFHPFIFAIYPIVFFYNHNIGEVKLNDTIIPILFSLVIAAIIYLLNIWLVKEKFKAALLTTIFLVFTFYYGHLVNAAESIGVTVTNHRHYQLIPFIFLLYGFAIYFSKKSKSKPIKMTTILNYVSIFLVLFNITLIIVHQISKQEVVLNEEQFIIEGDLSQITYKPDVYFIILDEYAHPEVIKELKGYDNSEFLTFLSQEGFFVAENSETFSNDSYHVLASILNMEIIKKSTQHTYINLLRNNLVFEVFKKAGYENYHIPGTGTVAMSPMKNADCEYFPNDNPNEWILKNNFYIELLKTTIFRGFVLNLDAKEVIGDKNIFAITTENAFDKIIDIVPIGGPKFSYIHIDSPHAPYVFDENGNYIGFQNEPKIFYLGQYIYITKKIEQVVRTILEKSANPPIIIIQSDHGVRGKDCYSIGFEERHWQKIFNAYYFPNNIADDILNDNISPVDNFRIIFNLIFGQNYKLVSDNKVKNEKK